MPAKHRTLRSKLASTCRFFAIVVCCLLGAFPLHAKRSAPKPVAAVIANHVEYSAPSERMGFVIATDVRTKKELWRERIYAVRIDPEMEKDVQDVFITTLVLEGGALVITNERGAVYGLDLATRKITKRK
jgi:hypothetical protein